MWIYFMSFKLKKPRWGEGFFYAANGWNLLLFFFADIHVDYCWESSGFMGRRCCGDVGHASGLFLPCIKNCRMKAFPLAARKCTDVHFRQVEWWAYAILAAFSLERLLYVYVWLNPVVWMKVELPCLCMCSHTSGGVNANTFILCFFVFSKF